MIDLDDHPAVLPAGYRFRWEWIGSGRTAIAGTYRCREWVRIVQRVLRGCSGTDDYHWVDIGFWDEVFVGGKVEVSEL